MLGPRPNLPRVNRERSILRSRPAAPRTQAKCTYRESNPRHKHEELVCYRYTTGKSCPSPETDGIFSALRVLSPGYMPGLGSEEDWGREGDNGGELSSVSETMFSFVERVLSEIVIYIRRLELSAYLVRISYTWPGSNLRPSAREADVIATRP